MTHAADPSSRTPADDTPVPTGIEALVCDDIARRQAMGTRKYGTTLADNPAALPQRLQHLYEELLDGANYTKWAMVQLQRQVALDEPVLTLPELGDAPTPAPQFKRPVHLSLTITAPNRAAAAAALTNLADAMADGGTLLPGEFCSQTSGGAVVQGELDQPDLSGVQHG